MSKTKCSSLKVSLHVILSFSSYTNPAALTSETREAPRDVNASYQMVERVGNVSQGCASPPENQYESYASPSENQCESCEGQTEGTTSLGGQQGDSIYEHIAEEQN